MSSNQKEADQTLEGQDLLHGSQTKSCEVETRRTCRCTKKCLIIVGIIVVMLLLYGLGLAIGLAVGLDKDKESGTKGEETMEKVVGVVVSDHEDCSNIGRDILARYGTAVDAAIATLICNGVTQPHSMGIGGGCFMLIYDKHEGKTTVINGRETSPHYLTPEKYANMTTYQVNARRVAVPGELKAYQEAHTRYGRLPWKELFKPTIKMIRDGFPLSTAAANALDYLVNTRNIKLTEFPALCSVFCADTQTGKPKKVGDTVHWDKLGDTLQGIADQGVDYIYNSPLTNTIVEELRREGGVLDISDFIMEYKVKVSEPLTIELENATVHTMDGATGGAVVGLVMNILKRYPWFDTTSVEGQADFYHRLLEAMKFSDADRSLLGDPDYDNTTWVLEKMRSDEYADILRTKITERTHEVTYYTQAVNSYEELMGTSHLSVLSPYGDAVSVTSTVNWYFGSMIMSNSTGIIWNNEMDDFNTRTKAGEVNQLEPGKRPLSSMAPTIVLDQQGNVRLVTGAAGGSRIATTVAQILAKVLLLQEPIEKATDDKRVHHILAKNTAVVEDGFPQDVLEILRDKKGHLVEIYDGSIFSVVESVSVDSDGDITGYADQRKGEGGKASYMYRTVPKTTTPTKKKS